MREYFFGTDEDGLPPVPGAWFERVGGEGGAPNAANRFTAEDVVALSMRSLEVPARTAVLTLGSTGTPDSAARG